MKKLIDEVLLEDTLFEMNKVVAPFLISLRKDMPKYNNLLNALAQGVVALGGDDCCLHFKLDEDMYQSCNPFPMGHPHCLINPAMSMALDEDGKEISAEEVIARLNLSKKAN